jgi:hypothetical protein
MWLPGEQRTSLPIWVARSMEGLCPSCVSPQRVVADHGLLCDLGRAPSPIRVPPQITADAPTPQPSPSSTGRAAPSASAAMNTEWPLGDQIDIMARAADIRFEPPN